MLSDLAPASLMSDQRRRVRRFKENKKNESISKTANGKKIIVNERTIKEMFEILIKHCTSRVYSVYVFCIL